MTEHDLDRLADRMWERAPKARTLTNKQVGILIVSVFIFASGIGITWNKLLSFPSITKEQWGNVYGYSVKDQPERERKYSRIINGFRSNDQLHDMRIKGLEKSYNEVKTNIKSINLSISRIEGILKK